MDKRVEVQDVYNYVQKELPNVQLAKIYKVSEDMNVIRIEALYDENIHVTEILYDTEMLRMSRCPSDMKYLHIDEAIAQMKG
jgi:hypothetical protein